MPKILIFCQDDALSDTLSTLLTNNSYEVSVFSAPDKAIDAIRKVPHDLVLIDFPPNNVFNHELLTSIHCFQEFLPIMVIVDDHRINTAQKAIKSGAVAYATKPLNPEALLLSLKIALSYVNLYIENRLYKRNFLKTDEFNFMSVSSEPMLQIYTLIEKTAKTDSAIMLSGEIGTGKETIARVIHAKSQRRQYSFCKVDCAGLPENLEESELFGYAREIGSQKAQHIPGIFEKNNHGTVFLDNIDVLPINIQIKLLYLLQNKKIQLVASPKIVDIEVRLIVGSACDLRRQTAAGEFCETLYRKLSMVPILLPPLRERRKDIPALVEHFLSCFTYQNSKEVEISSQALAVLCEDDWPGNIKQLKNLVKRLVIANETGEITCEELPPELTTQTAAAKINLEQTIDDQLDDLLSLKKYLQSQERFYMQKVLERSGGDKNLTAKKLGISLASFYRKWHEAML
ncbi:MAG: sigma-54 dependent transcriptional regulator [Victivallaceae bacterium]|nr:sigma-54 dependent transcriptional regulator [Victivallaceae bacterium]